MSGRRLLRLVVVALRSIARNRLRSFLTALGVVIGVAAVVVMVAVGRGAQLRVEREIAALGRNMLSISGGASQFGGVARGAGSVTRLSLTDVERLREEARLVAAVSPSIRVGSQAVAGNVNWQTLVYGVSPEYLTIRGWQLERGEAFTERDVRVGAKVVLLGATVAANLFAGADPVGERLRLGTVPVRVVGVLAKKGETGFGQDQDDVVLAPVSTVLGRLAAGREIQQILVSVADERRMDAASAEVRDILRRAHRLAAAEVDDFTVRSQADLATAATSTSRTFTLLLGAVASVSLLVGGIGIMNIMLVSVTERTREIGLRLAVGARARDVLLQFLVEALVLTLAGAALGLVVALVGCALLAGLTELEVVPEAGTLALATAVAALVGLVFGIAPARRAANLDPIEALRHE